MTLVCVPGTVISRPQLSRTRYETAPVDGSQASETLHEVLAVERKFDGRAGAFRPADDASSADSGDAIADGSGSVTSVHALATTNAATAHESVRRTAEAGRARGMRDSRRSPSRSTLLQRTAVDPRLEVGLIEPPVAEEMTSLTDAPRAHGTDASVAGGPRDRIHVDATERVPALLSTYDADVPDLGGLTTRVAKHGRSAASARAARTLAAIAAALTPTGRLLIDGWDPLIELALPRRQSRGR